MTSTTVLIVAPTAREIPGRGRVLPFGTKTALVGIGHGAQERTRNALVASRASVLVSIGLCGALDKRLETADIVINDGVSVDGGSGEDIALDPALQQAAFRTLAGSRVAVHLGGALTTAQPVLTPDAKAGCAAASNAMTVDMETYWITAAAREAGVPMLSIRTVIDDARYELPAFVGDIMAGGGRHELLHALAALRNPGNLRPMMDLALRSRRASSATRAMLRALFPEIIFTLGAAEAHS
jgi:nucleoside phosphorylase